MKRQKEQRGKETGKYKRNREATITEKTKDTERQRNRKDRRDREPTKQSGIEVQHVKQKFQIRRAT